MSSREPVDARRAYRSTRRRQQADETRATVVAAATTLFSDRGWSATGMRDVAKEAGVSVETVYGKFGSKADLLLAAIDVGVVGDAALLPLSERPEFAALGSGDLVDRIAAAARLLANINARTSGLRRALSQAAGSEPQLAAEVSRLEQRRRVNLGEGAAMILGRPADDDVLDHLWGVASAEVFHLLTGIGGRSVQDYERWIATTIRQVLAVDRERTGP